MFGYIRPFMPSLRMCEYEYYRAAYCGLCRAHGTVCGQASRFCLSYDAVFLALLRSVLTAEDTRVTKRRCFRYPLRRRPMLDITPEMMYTAAAATALTVFKLDDDISDERGGRRLAARAARPLTSPWLKRAGHGYGGLVCDIRSALERQTEIEDGMNTQNASADAVAEAFGRVFALTASRGMEGDNATVAAAVGRHIGRWLYCIDALDDFKEDARRNRFNPFVMMYGDGGPDDESKKTLMCLLSGEAAAAHNALELADRRGNPEAWGILDNILNEGIPHVTAAVLAGSYRKPRRDSIDTGKKCGNEDIN